MKLVSESHTTQRPTGLSELEILRTITAGFAAFGNAVRASDVSDAEKSMVLAHLAEASNGMMDATRCYLRGLSELQYAMEADTRPYRHLSVVE